jgi:hypothetical protein
VFPETDFCHQFLFIYLCCVAVMEGHLDHRSFFFVRERERCGEDWVQSLNFSLETAIQERPSLPCLDAMEQPLDCRLQ